MLEAEEVRQKEEGDKEVTACSSPVPPESWPPPQSQHFACASKQQ